VEVAVRVGEPAGATDRAEASAIVGQNDNPKSEKIRGAEARFLRPSNVALTGAASSPRTVERRCSAGGHHGC